MQLCKKILLRKKEETSINQSINQSYKKIFQESLDHARKNFETILTSINESIKAQASQLSQSMPDSEKMRATLKMLFFLPENNTPKPALEFIRAHQKETFSPEKKDKEKAFYGMLGLFEDEDDDNGAGEVVERVIYDAIAHQEENRDYFDSLKDNEDNDTSGADTIDDIIYYGGKFFKGVWWCITIIPKLFWEAYKDAS
jgi:hypothetical protein